MLLHDGIVGFVLLPLIGYTLLHLPFKKHESVVSRIAFTTITLQLLLAGVVTCVWVFSSHAQPLNFREISLYRTPTYDFYLDFYFDSISAVYLCVGAFITFLITRYSRYYFHLEQGYQRFFSTILLFFLGYNITVLSGNFETLFIGWEFLGISSFLLVGFYRERYLPVKNAVKVFSIYRIGDIGIVLAMWASHHLWNANIAFQNINDYALVHNQLAHHTIVGTFISLCLLIAALAKSAQLPFSSWLPRAMEGPTPSSAIFYGSLSVHIGVFLLLRTFPFWQHQILVRILIAAIGLLTALVGYSTSRVQSTIKTQIAYASITQIGIMFIEVSLGLHWLVLIHFAGNAFLRTYQLLVSPSVVSYLIRDKFYHGSVATTPLVDRLPARLRSTLFVLSLKEFTIDRFLRTLAFRPFIAIGKHLRFLTPRSTTIIIPALLAMCGVLAGYSAILPESTHQVLPPLYSLLGLLLVLRSFTERHNPFFAFVLLLLNHVWVVLAIQNNDLFGWYQLFLYSSGIIVAAVLGLFVLWKLYSSEPDHFTLNTYYGHAYEHPVLSKIFLIAALAMMGFPISPTCIGIDLVFTNIHQNNYLLAIAVSLSFILSGITLIRMYSRLFLGTHVKTYHPTPLTTA